MERYEDPSDPLNAATFHTGKACIEKGCSRPAGTHWSRFWCQPCNARRMSRIGGFLQEEVKRYTGEDVSEAHPGGSTRDDAIGETR